MKRIVCFHSDVDFGVTTHLAVSGVHGAKVGDVGEVEVYEAHVRDRRAHLAQRLDHTFG